MALYFIVASVLLVIGIMVTAVLVMVEAKGNWSWVESESILAGLTTTLLVAICWPVVLFVLPLVLLGLLVMWLASQVYNKKK